MRVTDIADEAANRTLVQHVRTMNPLLRIQGGALTAHGARLARVAAGRRCRGRRRAPVLALVARVLGEADALLSGAAARPEANHRGWRRRRPRPACR